MRVADVMTTDVVTVRPADPYKKALIRMLETGVSALPVVEEDGSLIGIVTEADFMAKDAYGTGRRRPLAVLADLVTGVDTTWVKKAAGCSVRDVMTRRVVSATSRDEIHDAARQMLEAHVKRLPVVDDGRLVGIVSRRDLLDLFRRSDDSLRREIEAMLRDPVRSPEIPELVCFVWDGEVLLEGTVNDPRDVAIVGSIVRRMPGVVKVHNNLVAEPREEPPLDKEVYR